MTSTGSVSNPNGPVQTARLRLVVEGRPTAFRAAAADAGRHFAARVQVLGNAMWIDGDLHAIVRLPSTGGSGPARTGDGHHDGFADEEDQLLLMREGAVLLLVAHGQLARRIWRFFCEDSSEKEHLNQCGRTMHDREPAAGPEALPIEQQMPDWNAELREFRVGDDLVKQFRQPAPRQEELLCAFQAQAWPPRVDNPFISKAGQSRKQLLSQTLKNLNRNQQHPVIHFSSDGRGGVRWSWRGQVMDRAARGGNC